MRLSLALWHFEMQLEQVRADLIPLGNRPLLLLSYALSAAERSPSSVLGVSIQSVT